jgi:hypothetical protein
LEQQLNCLHSVAVVEKVVTYQHLLVAEEVEVVKRPQVQQELHQQV